MSETNTRTTLSETKSMPSEESFYVLGCQLNELTEQIDGVYHLCNLFKTIDPDHINGMADSVRDILCMMRLEAERINHGLSYLNTNKDYWSSHEYIVAAKKAGCCSFCDGQ